MQASRGYLTIAIYCLSTALSAVWVTFTFSSISGSLLTFVTLLTAFGIFFGAHVVSGGQPFSLLRSHFSDVVILNILTVASWYFMFLALQRVEASVESAIYQGCVPIAVLACGLSARQLPFRSLHTIGCLMISLCLFSLVAARVTTAGVIAIEPARLYYGIALATVAGVAGGIYVYWSAEVVKKTQCKTLDILCNRFYLLLVLTGMISLPQLFGGAALHTVDLTFLGKLVLLSLVSVVIPVFTLQHAIDALGAPRVSVIVPCVPALVLLIEQKLAGWPSPLVPVLIVATCMAVLFSNIWMRRRPSQIETKPG